MDKILYSAIVLDDQSHDKLINHLDNIIPNDWKKYAHHMTIVFGKGLSDEWKKYLGMKIKLTAIEVGISEMTIAVKVKGFYSDNEIPHITVAVNINQGGKPFMSNKISDWKPINEITNIDLIDLYGFVKEIKSN